MTAIKFNQFLPKPIYSNAPVKKFAGNSEALIQKVQGTVNRVLDGMDFNGLPPYLKIIDQLEKGTPFAKCTLTGDNEGSATTCVGMSKQVLEKIREEQGVEGRLIFSQDET